MEYFVDGFGFVGLLAVGDESCLTTFKCSTGGSPKVAGADSFVDR